jgi:chromosome segregation ATPase
MTEDLVTRLRSWMTGLNRSNPPGHELAFVATDAAEAADEIERLWAERDALMGKAADEIERLRAERDALRALLAEASERLPDWFDSADGLHCRIKKAIHATLTLLHETEDKCIALRAALKMIATHETGQCDNGYSPEWVAKETLKKIQ